MIAAALVCTVVGITDGDTLTARCPDHQPAAIKVRLADIDAPELRQAWGRRSKESLAALCFGHEATVLPRTTDRYGRTVAEVSCASVDAGAYQLRSGMAWVFRRYTTNTSLLALEAEARQSRIGFWADAVPIPPWEWRKRRRTDAP
jgi:micrococcal nuclease